MESNKQTIEFTIPAEAYDEELNLPPGNYKAEVVEVSSTNPVQYQIRHLDISTADKKVSFEEQLILIKDVDADEKNEWIDAHHNSRSATIQSIGEAIAKAFQQ
jgi:hypothetical protein